MNELDNNPKFSLQDSQYKFPYHHIPYINGDKVYLTRHLAWGLEYLCYTEHVKHLADNLKVKSILEAGCGDGRVVGELQRKDRKLMGVDLSVQSISFASAFFPEVDFQPISVGELREKYELVLAVEVLEHIPDVHIKGFLDQIRSVCEDNGHLIISVPSAIIPTHRKHYRHYTREILLSQVSKERGFELVSLDYVYRHPFFLNFVNRLFFNKLWTFWSPIIGGAIWRHVWNSRVTNANRGRHLVAHFQAI